MVSRSQFSNVTRAVNHTTDLNSFGQREVEHDIMTHAKTPYIGTHLCSAFSESWLVCVRLTSADQAIEKLISRARIVTGNEQPDLVEVRLSRFGD